MAFETLKSRGVKFEPPEVLEFPWGYAARFQDPDGNQLQVREGRGAFRLQISGSLHLCSGSLHLWLLRSLGAQVGSYRSELLQCGL